jgi:hypothetical protein
MNSRQRDASYWKARRLARPAREFEKMERRALMSAVPYGAADDDTAEFMLGDVSVAVVLMESNGEIDANREDWQPQEIENVKQAIRDGLIWWENLLAAQASVHTLKFHPDFTYADRPIQTGYEPISRPSDDYGLWIEDFFSQVGLGEDGSVSARIRQFNNELRLEHQTHWAFTIFVVDADEDADKQFDPKGSFEQSFAFAGGRFFVTTSQRPAATIAHETAHMFWAMDEYPGSRTYFDRRGYYNTQNLNASDGNTNPDSRVRSLMDSAVTGYALSAVSTSALEMIGWRDSDHDGIFDMLDVAHLLVGAGNLDPTMRQYAFEGRAQVQTLPNLNSSGTGNDMTINRIDRIEVRFDEAAWQTVAEPGTYQAELQLNIAVPRGVGRLQLRAVDTHSGVTSNVLTDQFVSAPLGWHNETDPFDVDGDAILSPLDALLVINQINATGSRALDGSSTAPPYIDVNGDGFLSPVDALMVINHLNAANGVSDPPPDVPAATNAEGETSPARPNTAGGPLLAEGTASARRRRLAMRQLVRPATESSNEHRSTLGRITAGWAELVDLAVADASTSRLSAPTRCSI